MVKARCRRLNDTTCKSRLATSPERRHLVEELAAVAAARIATVCRELAVKRLAIREL
jgi:hypothetical protein